MDEDEDNGLGGMFDLKKKKPLRPKSVEESNKEFEAIQNIQGGAPKIGGGGPMEKPTETKPNPHPAKGPPSPIEDKK